MKNVMLCFGLLFLVSGCKEKLEGRLQVAEPVNVVIKDKLYQIPQGPFTANFILEGSKSATLELVLKRNSTAKIKLNIAPGYPVPGRNGPINLPSSSTGQPFDINGKIATDITGTYHRNEIRSCVRRVYWDYVCRNVRLNDGSIERVCQNEQIEDMGYQDVYVKDTSFQTVANAGIYKTGTRRELAKFSGSKSWTESEILSVGRCR